MPRLHPNRIVAAFLVMVGAVQAQVVPQPGAPGAVRYDGWSVVRVHAQTPAQVMALMALADDVWTHSPRTGPVDVALSPAHRAAVDRYAAAQGLRLEVRIADLQAAVDAERARIQRSNTQRDITWFQDYKNLTQINAKLAEWVAAYPAWASTSTIGAGHEGRPLTVIRVSAPDTPGNPRNQRAQILFTGTQHAREWISPMTVMYGVDQLLSTYAVSGRVRNVMDKIEFLVVPVVNPDGYEYAWTTERFWRKNRRNNGGGVFGVDDNRNWPYQWGGEGASTQPNSETYRGPSAGSEPEVQAVMALVTANPRLRAHIDFHSYAQLILSPWAYTIQLPPDAALFDDLNLTLQSAIAGVHGRVYDAGPTYTTIYPASGGVGDWTYGAANLWAWTIELRGDGFDAPATEIIPCAEENFEAMLTLAEEVLRPVRFSFPAGVPQSLSAGQATSFDVSITAPGATVDGATAQLRWRETGGGAFGVQTLTPLGGALYRATIPAQSCGHTIEFFVQATTTNGRTGQSPDAAPDQFYSAAAVGEQTVFEDACEVATGWTVGAAGDNATTGVWGDMDPQATGAQPEDDHSAAGTRCWITDGRAGTGIGSFDIDGGTTTLTSPRFSALPVGDVLNPRAVVSYWRWYSNNQGSNPNTNTMPVMVSNNDGATWTQVELVAENAGAWVRHEFAVSDFVTPTANMRLRFIARDLTGSIVEAGVDDVKVVIRGCPSDPADFNGDGFVDFFDFDAFVLCFEGGECPPGRTADFNGDGFVDFFDYDAFVSAFEGH